MLKKEVKQFTLQRALTTSKDIIETEREREREREVCMEIGLTFSDCVCVRAR